MPSLAPRFQQIVRIALFTFLALLAALAGGWWVLKLKLARERAAWKRPALERLAAVKVSDDEIRAKLENLNTSSRWWAGEQVLVMANGEYIVYAFRHGANDGAVDHLFLGHGSDGRWLYSSFHFCNHMVGISASGPPASIAEFKERYSVHEFDGKSDDCLKHTWPPE